MKEKTVIIGMSGGVDSSVAALLLKQQGYTVIGATMQLLDNEETKKSIEDAKEIAKILDIKHYVWDFRKEFKDQIINHFISSYQNGQTPNPCVICNKKFKFGLFYQKARELGVTYIATGHYAKVENNHLVMSNVDGKDQSYFLCQIEKEVLPHILFPLNQYKSKDEIRQIAQENKLPVSMKKDSQEICFIPNDDYKAFLQNKIKFQPGNIVLKDQTTLGKHQGLYQYTIGQRKGLNISYKEPLYVIELDTKNNNLIVGSNNDLMKKVLTASHMNYLTEKEDLTKYPIYAKIRSRGTEEEVENIKENEDNTLTITFKNPIRAITPGQFIVFYNNKKECLGGAYIIK